ncbi:MAG: NAD-dependent epimerase/dehydratase family protein [Bacteroides sp.]|nr:NAD-dependent epimerase/dehydratase family protein [Bacteroides sp.]
MMNILVLGGTGAMGSYIVKILAKQGYEVDVTSRKRHKDREESIHYIQGNAHEVDFVIQLLTSEHYIAIIDFMLYTTHEFEEVYKIYLDYTDQYFF